MEAQQVQVLCTWRRSRHADAVSFHSALCLVALAVVAGFTYPVFAQNPPSAAPTPTPSSTADSSAAGGDPWTTGATLRGLPYATGLSVDFDCFARADVVLVFPHLSSLLTAPVGLGAGGPISAVALPNAHLNPTVSPLLQLGAFRLGPGYGELAFSYRFLVTEGSESLPVLDGSGAIALRSRLNLQTFSFDYLRNDCILGRDAVLGWEVGVRGQIAFFDTQAQTVASYVQARNYFFGAGPRAGFGITKPLPYGLSVFGRFDGALIVGYNTTQNYVVTLNVPPSGLVSGTFGQVQTELSPSVAVQAGAAWSPVRVPACRFRGGYQFEQWYNLGRVADSRGDLSAHGLFVSCELGF